MMLDSICNGSEDGTELKVTAATAVHSVGPLMEMSKLDPLEQ